MPLLKEILYKVPLRSSSGDMDRDVKGLCYDSRKAKHDFLFVAIPGARVDGHDYIADVIQQGCTSIICEQLPEYVTYAVVENSSYALGVVAANFYGNPSRHIKTVAVTGTNGKTTCVFLLHQLFKNLGYKTGLLSTVENKVDDEIIPAWLTTPDAIQLNELLALMVQKGCEYCFMEASSQGIVQNRLAGIDLSGAVFTNISHDHLDYHVTFSEYIKAKKLLFDRLGKSAFALVNADDKRGSVMLQNTNAEKRTFSLKTVADFKAKVISNTLEGLEMDVENHQVWFRLIG